MDLCEQTSFVKQFNYELHQELMESKNCFIVRRSGRHYKRANERAQRIEVNKLFTASKKLNKNGFGK